nr:unnamed protein product [Callosobruchus chinensis]CAH7755067.1 unnamed protein product [Callosobruchus chinensis]
MRILYSDV